MMNIITNLKELTFVSMQNEGQSFKAEVSLQVLNYLINNEFYNLQVEKVVHERFIVKVREVD